MKKCTHQQNEEVKKIIQMVLTLQTPAPLKIFELYIGRASETPAVPKGNTYAVDLPMRHYKSFEARR